MTNIALDKLDETCVGCRHIKDNNCCKNKVPKSYGCFSYKKIKKKKKSSTIDLGDIAEMFFNIIGLILEVVLDIIDAILD